MHDESTPICGECGLSPIDPDATRHRRMHAGNRLAFRAWLCLLFCSVVLAMPWVQTRAGWDLAEMDQTAIRDPRPRIVPMVDPLVRWRDVHAAAAGDADAVTLLRRALTESIPLTHSTLNPEFTTLQVEMVQNEFMEHGSRAKLGRHIRTGSNLLYSIRDGIEFTRHGWPYTWHHSFNNRLINYEEVVFSSNPMGIDPEPLLTVEYDHHARWYWSGLLASLALAWWSGWLVARVLRGIRARRSIRIAGRWIVVFGLLLVSLILGLQPKKTISGNRFSSAFETIPTPIDPFTQSIDEVRDLIDDDDGVRLIAQRLLDRHGTLDRPNALVGMIAYNPVQSASYALNFGYWGETMLSYTQISRFFIDEDGNVTPVSNGIGRRNQLFHLSVQGLSFNLRAGKDQSTRYLMTIHFATVLIWLTGAWLLLRLLELAFRTIYRRVQRRRMKREVCIWCKYPIPSNPASRSPVC